jgi:hypothetical protein
MIQNAGVEPIVLTQKQLRRNRFSPSLKRLRDIKLKSKNCYSTSENIIIQKNKLDCENNLVENLHMLCKDARMNV